MEKMDPDPGHEHFLQFYSVLIQKNSKIKLSLFMVVFMLNLMLRNFLIIIIFFSSLEFGSLTL